jgi:hypothetical protein
MDVLNSFHLRSEASGASGSDPNLHLWWGCWFEANQGQKKIQKKDAN